MSDFLADAAAYALGVNSPSVEESASELVFSFHLPDQVSETWNTSSLSTIASPETLMALIGQCLDSLGCTLQGDSEASNVLKTVYLPNCDPESQPTWLMIPMVDGELNAGGKALIKAKEFEYHLANWPTKFRATKKVHPTGHVFYWPSKEEWEAQESLRVRDFIARRRGRHPGERPYIILGYDPGF